MDEPRTLRDEIRQQRPFRSASQEATLGLFRTADILRRSFSRLLEPAGVTLQQYNVLRILRGAGDEGLPTLTIGERMIERSPGVSRMIDRLVAKGWVVRRRASDDRRQVLCRISNQGLALLEALDEPMDRADDQSLAMLDGDEQRTLIDLLDRIRHGHPECH